MSVYGKRNSLFVQVSSIIYTSCNANYLQYLYKKDKNKNDPHASVDMISAVGYGHLDFILALTLP